MVCQIQPKPPFVFLSCKIVFLMFRYLVVPQKIMVKQKHYTMINKTFFNEKNMKRS